MLEQEQDLFSRLQTRTSRRGLLKGAIGLGLGATLFTACVSKEEQIAGSGASHILLGLEGTKTTGKGWRLKRYKKQDVEYDSVPLNTTFLNSGSEVLIEGKKHTDIYVRFYRIKGQKDPQPRIFVYDNSNQTSDNQIVDFSTIVDKNINTDVVVFENAGGDKLPQKYFKIIPVYETMSFRVDELKRIK